MQHSENEDHAVMDSGLLILCHTFRDPHQVPYLLLPQSHISEEDSIVKLHHHCKSLSGLVMKVWRMNIVNRISIKHSVSDVIFCKIQEERKKLISFK